MIQENNSNNNHFYDQEMENHSTPLPSMPLNRIEDHSEFLLNGQYITMDMQQYQQHSQQQLLPEANEQFMMMQQQQYFDPSMHAAQDVQFFTYSNTCSQQQQQEQHIQQFACLNSSGDCPPTPEDTPPTDLSVNTLNEISNGASDTSTIEDEINPSEEKFAYLQELNSDNLMQFSQQSALQEMLLKEQFQGKSNLHILPTVEEHDIGNHNFKLGIGTRHSKGKTNWKYSEDLNKLYIRMNDTFTVDAIYTPTFPAQPLRLRVFICFVKQVSEPVLRCQNHLSKDVESNSIKHKSVLRCDNPDAEYIGNANGNSIKERFCVIVPLTAGITQNDKSIKQTIAFQFTCQNSCIGRKETCLMFLLEGMNGEILSQRLMNIRICACPKRDKSHDEKTYKKRSSTDDTCQPAAKQPKLDLPSTVIKEESSSSEFDAIDKQFDLQRTASGGFRLVMELSNIEVALSTINYVRALESANIVDDTQDAPRSRRNVRKLKRLYSFSTKYR